ncbi:MAG: hypothetical protein AB7K67_08470 [Hyphomicrobiaceae bacterium]
MSVRDHYEPQRASPGEPETADQADLTLGMVEDLRDILDLIAGQMADADQRHADALKNVHERLEQLSDQAQQARSELPIELSATMERIEDGLAILAERVSLVDGGGPRQSHSAVAPHDPHPHDPHDWDHESAEALARLYDSGHPAGGPARPAVSEDDRRWFDARLAGVIERITEEITAQRADGVIAALDERLARIEQKFESAVSQSARRVDVEGLRFVEAHVIELGAHVEAARAQLARLDGVEQQLQAILARLDAPQRDMHSHAPAPLSETDIASIAAAVAEKAVVRAPEPAEDPARLQALERLLQAYISERRLGEEHAGSALAEMRGDLKRLADKVAGEPAPATAPAAAPTSVSGPAPGPSPIIASMTGSMTASTTGAMTASAAAPRRATPVAPDTPANPERDEPPVLKSGAPAPEALESDVRQAFQASAMRAKLKAQAVAQAVFEETLAETERLEPRASVAERVVARFSPPSNSGPRPWLLVAACCGLLVGLGFLLVDFLTARSPQPAPVATAGPHAAAPAFKDETRAPAAVAPAEKVQVAPPPLGVPSGTAPTNAMPGAPPPARTRPETVTDDLSLATPPNSAHTVRVNGVPAPNAPIGIEVETPSATTNAAEIERLRQRQRMAAVSSRLGAQAPAPVADLGTSAIAASLTREQPAPAQPKENAGEAGLVLPPAMIGPLSLRLAAAKGDPSAEFEIAARYAEGKGVPQDFKQAQAWYQRSAAQGFAQAQYRLATLYERGLGVTADPGKARVWYGRAAEQGNVKAMHNLAVLAAGRQGVAPDYATAARWFGEAARRGLSDSQFNLAVLTENGLGLPKNVKDAYFWFSIAARGSDPEATRRRDQVRAKLGAADIAAVDKAVAAWHPESAPLIANDPRTAGEAWKASGKDQAQDN